MADIFSTTPGAVVAVDGPGIPMQLSVEGWGGYAAFQSIIRSIRIQTQNGTQFMHTMEDLVYVYTYGERIGAMTLSGVSFAYSCEDAANGFPLEYHGLEYVYAYYLRTRASELERPLEIILGVDMAFYAFMVSMDMAVEDPENNVGSFTLTLKMIPSVTPLVIQEDEEDDLVDGDGDDDEAEAEGEE